MTRNIIQTGLQIGCELKVEVLGEVLTQECCEHPTQAFRLERPALLADVAPSLHIGLLRSHYIWINALIGGCGTSIGP